MILIDDILTCYLQLKERNLMKNKIAYKNQFTLLEDIWCCEEHTDKTTVDWP